MPVLLQLSRTMTPALFILSRMPFLFLVSHSLPFIFYCPEPCLSAELMDLDQALSDLDFVGSQRSEDEAANASSYLKSVTPIYILCIYNIYNITFFYCTDARGHSLSIYNVNIAFFYWTDAGGYSLSIKSIDSDWNRASVP